MASLNFPTGASDGATYDFTDDQGNTLSYVYVSDKQAWYVKAPAGQGNNAVEEANKDGIDYVRNNGGWLKADYFSGDYSDLTNVPDAGGFTAGTKMVFAQATPDTGWTIDTTNNNAALRIVSDSTGGTTGGSQNFTSCFTNRSVSVSNVSGSGSTTVTVPNTDSANPGTGGLTDGRTASISVNGQSLDTNTTGSHSHTYKSTNGTATYGFSGTPSWFVSTVNTDRAGGGQSHAHGLSQSEHQHYLAQTNDHVHTFSSSASGSSSISGGTGDGVVDLSVKYTNVCIGVKN